MKSAHRRNSRTDYTGDITGHTVIQHMVFGSYFVAISLQTRLCHGHGTQAGSTNQRIDLLLAE